MKPEIEIQLLGWEDAMPLARPIRERVFVVEQKVPRELEWDEWDPVSIHAIARDSAGGVIGTARLLPDGHLGRMAVLADRRRRGVGTHLAQALIVRAREAGLSRVILNAQMHAASFYEKLGFTARGPVFQEAGIDHVEMILSLDAR